MKKIFITATDTDAGKTHIAQALIIALNKLYDKVAAYKPVSAGCDVLDGKLINQDALLLKKHASCKQSIDLVNPVAFKEPIAPHIAAQKLNKKISVNQLINGLSKIEALAPDVIVTEGAGGWRLPLGEGKYLSELAQSTNQEVVLVVNMKLGCLNHAVLTYQAIINDGLECIGWVANCFHEMDYQQENIAELSTLIGAPLLAKIKHEPDVVKVSECFDASLLQRL